MPPFDQMCLGLQLFPKTGTTFSIPIFICISFKPCCTHQLESSVSDRESESLGPSAKTDKPQWWPECFPITSRRTIQAVKITWKGQGETHVCFSICQNQFNQLGRVCPLISLILWQVGGYNAYLAGYIPSTVMQLLSVALIRRVFLIVEIPRTCHTPFQATIPVPLGGISSQPWCRHPPCL